MSSSFYTGPNYFYDMEPPVIALVDTHLWKMFNSVGTEMIITKNGRKLFPTIKVRLYNLDPNAEYDVALHMRMSRNCRLKFQAKAGWKEAGTCDPKASKDIYVHFDSGKTGRDLMAKPLSFDKIRVTNSLPAALSSSGSMEKYNDFICLNSMHEYLPTIILSMRTPYGKRTFYYPLELTKFVAVTAYQNQQVTEIKINKNPFAKGFRADGQAKKRKSKQQENDEQPEGKRSSTESRPTSPDDNLHRLSPYQHLSDAFISAWAVRPTNTIVPCPFVFTPQSLFSRPHILGTETVDICYPRSTTNNSLTSQSEVSNVDVESNHLVSPHAALSLNHSETSMSPKPPSQMNGNNTAKLGFSIHRILYEL